MKNKYQVYAIVGEGKILTGIVYIEAINAVEAIEEYLSMNAYTIQCTGSIHIFCNLRK